MQLQEFPLSKTRLNKNNVVYSDEHRLCVRIKEKMVRPYDSLLYIAILTKLRVLSSSVTTISGLSVVWLA